MKQIDPKVVFGPQRAESYDQQVQKLAPLRDGMLLIMRAAFENLPVHARVLCVGVGTGTELIRLAGWFPNWTFVAVEPAPAMLDVCREKARKAGIESRCDFHEGYLESLPQQDGFDAATCLLVSHFIMDSADRTAFFGKIGERLMPGGFLASSDLSADMSSVTYRRQLEMWLSAMGHSGMSPEQVDEYRSAQGRDVALLPPDEVAALIEAAGFEPPVLVCQFLLIHGWISKVKG